MSLQTTLFGWANGVTNLPVVFAGQNGPKRGARFISMNVTTKTQLGHDSIEYADQAPIDGNQLVETIQGQRLVDVSLQVIRVDLADRFAEIDQLVASIVQTQWAELLDAGNLGFSEVVGPRDLTGVTKDSFENRVQADFRFNAIDQFTSLLDPIESVTITNATNGVDIVVEGA